MSPRILAAVLAGAFILPAAAQAQSRVAIPSVELFATVTGKWVLNPAACNDIREDVYDARRTESRGDRREDRRDQRVADCPASAYKFVPDAGQGPKYPVRVERGRVPREYRGQPMFINGDTIGPKGLPLETPGLVYAPVAPSQQFNNPFFRPVAPSLRAPTPVTQPRVLQFRTGPVLQRPTVQPPAYQQPTYQQPTYQQQTQPAYQQPQPQTYRQPTYQTAPNTVQQPTYQPAPQPTQPSNYRIENGIIIFE